MQTPRGALMARQLCTKHHIPWQANIGAQFNLKFRIAIFGSHFVEAEKSHSRDVSHSQSFSLAMKSAKRGKREIEKERDRWKESTGTKTKLAKGIDRKEIMEEGKREGNTKMWKTIKKVLGCGSYSSGTSKVERGDTRKEKRKPTQLSHRAFPVAFSTPPSSHSGLYPGPPLFSILHLSPSVFAFHGRAI